MSNLSLIFLVILRISIFWKYELVVLMKCFDSAQYDSGFVDWMASDYLRPAL